MTDKTTVTSRISALTASGLNGKSVTDVIVTKHGSVIAYEIVYSGGSQFLKSRQDVVEVGGTLDFGTGTII
jgi:hypothetical protein